MILGKKGRELVWPLPTRVKPFNGLIRTQLIRRPKRADNLVSLGRFGSRCSKAQRWANMAQGLGETNMEPARGFFGRGRAGPGALNSLIAYYSDIVRSIVAS